MKMSLSTRNPAIRLGSMSKCSCTTAKKKREKQHNTIDTKEPTFNHCLDSAAMTMLRMMHREFIMMVVVLLVSTILSAVAATEVVSSYQVAKDLTRRLDVGENCGPVISEMLNCFISNCLELSCSVQGVYNMNFGNDGL